MPAMPNDSQLDSKTRKCPHCGGAIDVEVGFCPHCQQLLTAPVQRTGTSGKLVDTKGQPIKNPWAVIGPFLVLVGVFLILAYNRGEQEALHPTPPPPAASADPAIPDVGQAGTLQTSVGLAIPVASSKSAFVAYEKATVAGDKYGVKELLGADQVFFVRAGTGVLCLDFSSRAVEVRITNGEYEGRKGWVVTENFKP